MQIKQNSLSKYSQKPSSSEMSQIADSVLNKGESNTPLLYNGPEVMHFASGKVKLFAEELSEDSNLDDLSIPKPVYPSRTSLKMHQLPSWLRRSKPSIVCQNLLVVIVFQWWS